MLRRDPDADSEGRLDAFISRPDGLQWTSFAVQFELAKKKTAHLALCLQPPCKKDSVLASCWN